MSDCTPCHFCGDPNAGHYMAHICRGCTCFHCEVRIPGEPHMPGYLETEQNEKCPIHGRKSEEAGE